MLTEKECREALTEIEESLCELEEIKTGVRVSCLFDENLEIVKQLFKEHFELRQTIHRELKDIVESTDDINLLKEKILDYMK